MADSEYPYPPDQFDEEATEVAYHGAHRAEESFWRQNLVYLIIIAVAVVVLLVLLFTIGGLGKSGDDRAESPTTAASSPDDSSKSEDASDGGGDSEEQGEPDKSTPVLVMNAGGISGMAGTWEKNLSDSGWTKVGIGTADNVQQESVVFYRDDKDKASAQALADEVGAGDARQSDEYDNRITFVAVKPPKG